MLAYSAGTTAKLSERPVLHQNRPGGQGDEGDSKRGGFNHPFRVIHSCFGFLCVGAFVCLFYRGSPQQDSGQWVVATSKRGQKRSERARDDFKSSG